MSVAGPELESIHISHIVAAFPMTRRWPKTGSFLSLLLATRSEPISPWNEGGRPSQGFCVSGTAFRKIAVRYFPVNPPALPLCAFWLFPVDSQRFCPQVYVRDSSWSGTAIGYKLWTIHPFECSGFHPHRDFVFLARHKAKSMWDIFLWISLLPLCAFWLNPVDSQASGSHAVYVRYSSSTLWSSTNSYPVHQTLLVILFEPISGL